MRGDFPLTISTRGRPLRNLLRKSRRGRRVSSAVSDEQWLQARRCARELDKVLDSATPRRRAIARAAAELHLTTRQIYNLLKRYALDRSVSALLPQRGRTRRKRLTGEVEAIIAATLREQWLVLEAAPVVAEIRARCEEAKQRPPSYVAGRPSKAPTGDRVTR